MRKASVFNQASAAGASILSKDISPTNEDAIFEIYLAISGFVVAPTFTVVRTVGGSSVSEDPNKGVLTNGGAYIFDIYVVKGQTINFQLDQVGTISFLFVKEYSPG